MTSEAVTSEAVTSEAATSEAVTSEVDINSLLYYTKMVPLVDYSRFPL